MIDRHARGSAAERAVVEYLRARGWTIVATNLHVHRWEVDIVARQGALVAVVEVRTRGTTAWSTGFGSVDSRKRRRIRLAGERLWAKRYSSDGSVERLRFDVASVSFDPQGRPIVEYAPAAF